MTYILAVACGLVNMVQFSFMTNVAMVMKADGIGNATQSATVLSIFTASAFVVGLLYGNIAKRLKQYSASFGVLCGVVLCDFALSEQPDIAHSGRHYF